MAADKVKLQSSDDEVFDVELEIARQSITIKTMLEGRIFILIFIKINCYY